MVQGSLKSVLMKFQEFFKEVSGKCQGCFKKVSGVFQVRLLGVSSSLRVFQGYLKEVYNVMPNFGQIEQSFIHIF